MSEHGPLPGSEVATPQMPLSRIAGDLGPLLVFFAAYEVKGILVATGVFMAASLGVLALFWWRDKRVAPMPLVSAVLVLIFGGLTLWLKDETFIKMKPTALYLLFGVTLLAGLRFDRPFLRYVFAQAFELTEAGWRVLTVRWALFFFALAALNEAVWRNTSTAAWVNFKVFAIMPLIFIFALAQTPLITRHQKPDGKNPD